jgi:hypothetical protein
MTTLKQPWEPDVHFLTGPAFRAMIEDKRKTTSKEAIPSSVPDKERTR